MSSKYTGNIAVACTAALGTTPAIPVDPYRAGTAHIPTGSPITSLTFYSSGDGGTTYQPLNDSGGTPIAPTVAANKSYNLNLSGGASFIAGCSLIKCVVNLAGTVNFSFGD